MGSEQDNVAIAAELPPPTEPKRKDKKWRKHPRKGALTKRPPPRPYKRLPEEKLQLRVQKLVGRMERAKRQVRFSKKRNGNVRLTVRVLSSSPLAPSDPSLTHTPVLWQHEDARRLLTKYSHEQTYRLRDSLQEANTSASEAAIPLPEFEPMQDHDNDNHTSSDKKNTDQ
jgi:hypothetical protein